MSGVKSLFASDRPNYASTSFPPPRPFQETAHHAAREGVAAGHKNQVVMAPTGAGKLYLGMRVAQEALAKGRSALLICDRTTLINQASETADRYGLSAHGVLQANHPRTDLSMPFQIASAQTLARREIPDADVIIVDECHTLLKAWTEHVPDCRAKVIGLSATPFSRGMGRLFTNLINATTGHELTEAGILVPLKVLCCTRTDMEGAETSGGEWTDHAAQERGMEIIGDVVSEWCEHAENRKTIIFGATIAHCEEMAKAFNAAGVLAAVFTSRTTPEQRAALLAEYRKPDSKVRILISVEALAKGFDVPDVGCIVDCRPLRKSLSTAMQMWGRGLRASPDTGKTNCILLDHSGNIVRFAEDFTKIFFDGLDVLDAGEKLDKAIRKDDEDCEPKGCPQCKAIPFFGHCMFCGFIVAKPSHLSTEPGRMVEMVIGRSGKSQPLRSIWEQCCAYARGHANPEKQAGRAYYIYRDATGMSPPREWRFEETSSAPISRDLLNKIKQKNIAFARSRAA